jgi:hypothetical protein
MYIDFYYITCAIIVIAVLSLLIEIPFLSGLTRALLRLALALADFVVRILSRVCGGLLRLIALMRLALA